MPQATVVGDSDAPREACEMAEQIGQMLAHLGVVVVTGGRGGVMTAASRGARSAGGLVVGILPGPDRAEANEWCSVVIPTGFGHARNVLTVLAGDFLVAIGGAVGTMSEICFAWIHGKPILTMTGYDGWVDRVGVGPLDDRASSTIRVCSNLDELREAVRETCRNMDLYEPG